MRCFSDFEKGAVMNQIILFGKYKVISLLGAGGFSKVYLVEHLKLKAYRAMKQVKKAQSDMPDFLKEANLLKNLNHPGIPIIYDYEEDEEYLYLFEEFIEGESLDEFIPQNKNLTMEEILIFGLQLCSILEYLHEQKPDPIVYQDFKPEHVYICKNQVKLVDFGLAVPLNEKNEILDQVYGTKEYCAPEKLALNHLGIVSDIYGAGKMLQYFFSGIEKKKQTIALHQIVEKAIQKDSDKRFQSVEELKKALNQALTDEISMKKEFKKHLIKKIAVGSGQSRIGATHFSIAISSYLNVHGISNCYENQSNAKETERSTEHFLLSSMKSKRHKSFLFSPLEKKKEESIKILDYGFGIKDMMEFLEADVCILLLGSREWELKYSYQLYEKFQFCKNIIFVCNWGDVAAARKIAKRIGHKVYCFPLDANPLCHNDEKEKFFSYMRKKEGW